MNVRREGTECNQTAPKVPNQSRWTSAPIRASRTRERFSLGRIGQNSQMPTAAAHRSRVHRTRGHVGCGGADIERRLAESRSSHPDTAGGLAYRVRQRNQVVILRIRRQRTVVADQFPSSGRGDPARVLRAQIPRMRLAGCGQRPDHGRRIRVDEGQRRHGGIRAPGSTAATGGSHKR
ncbi:Uncharacterised protein [Mycobacteroides abscessus subsp. abscessus]|nr:Uncharacterised protein [Mycobacteroides abscessus subsp. abscessus]